MDTENEVRTLAEKKPKNVEDKKTVKKKKKPLPPPPGEPPPIMPLSTVSSKKKIKDNIDIDDEALDATAKNIEDRPGTVTSTKTIKKKKKPPLPEEQKPSNSTLPNSMEDVETKMADTNLNEKMEGSGIKKDDETIKKKIKKKKTSKDVESKEELMEKTREKIAKAMKKKSKPPLAAAEEKVSDKSDVIKRIRGYAVKETDMMIEDIESNEVNNNRRNDSVSEKEDPEIELVDPKADLAKKKSISDELAFQFSNLEQLQILSDNTSRGPQNDIKDKTVFADAPIRQRDAAAILRDRDFQSSINISERAHDIEEPNFVQKQDKDESYMVKMDGRQSSSEDISNKIENTAKPEQSSRGPSRKNSESKINKEPPRKRQGKQKNFDYFDPRDVPASLNELASFVCSPIQGRRGTIVKCFIERNTNGSNKLAPVYTLMMEINSSSGRPIIFAKRKASSTAHYVISLDKDDLSLPREQRSDYYLGKLRYVQHTRQYVLYDNGENPEDDEHEMDKSTSPRTELVVIHYSAPKKNLAVRKLEVGIPAISQDGTSYVTWQPKSQRDNTGSLAAKFLEILDTGEQNVRDCSKIIFLHKRETKYDPLSSCIVDFRSRATCVSIKNFQLIHSQPTNQTCIDKYINLHPNYYYEDEGTASVPHEHVLLQMGKVGKDCFNMDFQAPLSALQAFGICLSRFDSSQK